MRKREVKQYKIKIHNISLVFGCVLTGLIQEKNIGGCEKIIFVAIKVDNSCKKFGNLQENSMKN